ncbi:MAG: NB-ARC domain-containing protein, partial [Jatrophihabitantaceae bacterium]
MSDGADRLAAANIESMAELATTLRQLRRRHARRREDSVLTYRELSARTGYAYGLIAEYFSGKVLPPTDRLDVLVQVLGADGAEQTELADARDRIEERRHQQRTSRLSEAPADVASFVGRSAELSQLDRQLLTSRRPSALPLVLVAGTGGVGKTALAVHWAHSAARHFPDGCLYLDLRGFGAGEPIRPSDALASLLRRLGSLPVPLGLDERATQYRTALAGRRMLLLLDNGCDPAQVRPLLPGQPGCAVIVTSRDTFAGLVARDGAHRVELQRLPLADAASLLSTLLAARPDLDPDELAALAERCARLPLALRLAAELASSRPEASIADLVDELASEQRALQLLNAGGDEQSSAAAVFSWSYRQLRPPVARLFRLLGLVPGSSVDAPAAAALAELTQGEAAELLDSLRRVNLIESGPSGRFGQHDLLRAYAKALAEAEESDLAQDDAVRRLVDYQLRSSRAAVRIGYSTQADSAAALDWLEAERNNLMAGLNLASQRGWTELVNQLAGVLFGHLLSCGHLDDAVTLAERHAEAARRAGDLAAESDALNNLGLVDRVQGRIEPALAHHLQALQIARRLGDRAREVRGLDAAGGVHHRV